MKRSAIRIIEYITVSAVVLVLALSLPNAFAQDSGVMWYQTATP